MFLLNDIMEIGYGAVFKSFKYDTWCLTPCHFPYIYSVEMMHNYGHMHVRANVANSYHLIAVNLLIECFIVWNKIHNQVTVNAMSLEQLGLLY